MKKVKNAYENSLKQLKFDKLVVKGIKKIDQSSILLTFFDSFAKTNNFKISEEEREILKVVRLLVISKRVVNFNKKALEKINQTLKIDDRFFLNYEQETVQNYQLTKAEIIKYFSYHELYKTIALIYASPLKDNPAHELYVKFFYYLIMYLNLDWLFNKKIILDNYNPFLVKLDVQLTMIKLLAEIDNEHYNDLIRQLNHWLSKNTTAKWWIKLQQRKLVV